MSQGVTKIQELLAGMKVNNGDGGGEERLDELAKLLKTSLGVSYKNNDAYLELAKHMTKFSIANDDGPNDDGDLQVSYQQRRGRTRARDTAGTGEAKQTRSSSTQSAARNKTFMEHASYSPSWHHQNDQSPAPKAPLRQEFPYPARRKSPPRYPSNNSKFLKGQNGSKAAASPDEKKDAEQKLRHRPQKRDFSAGSSPPRSASPSHRYYTPSSPRDRNHSSSRSSSPFAARPGLQEGENGDSIAFSGRSPGRSTVHAASIPPAMPHIPNMSSGISSQHPSGVPHHQRSRSQGVDYDTESISQPQIPRPHSESPMRKPASTDDEGDQPLAQPHRAFSKSPRGNQCAGNDIQLPDLSKISIPDIGSKDGEADGLFTPPPRSANSSFVDDPMSAYPIRGSSGLKPRSAFPDHLFGTTSQRANLIPDRSPSPMEIDETETPPPAKPAFSLGQDVKKTRRPTVARKVVGNSSSSRSVPSVSNELAFINAKREEARSYFISKDYRSSIHAYTQALKKFSVTTSELPRDTFAVLLSNRAACLLMVGAFDAAVSDCSNALQNVKMPLPSQPFSTDGGLMLKVKLYTRLGRANLKIGKYVESMRAFEDAFRTSEVASGFSKENHSEEEYKQNWQLLSQLKTEASLGQSDAKRLKDACENLTESMQVIASGKGDRTKYSEALSHVNVALSMATGCAKLIESKLSILAYFKRWRETAGFCERLAACNVLFDGIFIEDLAPLNPFPGVSAPRYLKADFFKNTRDEDSTTRDLKLSSRASAEAILRLPIEIAPMYLRALRLEERYPAADSSIRSLEEFLVAQGSTVLACGWLSKEREKLTLTKAQREEADELFRNQEFQKASQKYMDCLSVDREGCGSAIDGLNAGGRLHAVPSLQSSCLSDGHEETPRSNRRMYKCTTNSWSIHESYPAPRSLL